MDCSEQEEMTKATVVESLYGQIQCVCPNTVLHWRIQCMCPNTVLHDRIQYICPKTVLLGSGDMKDPLKFSVSNLQL